MQNTVLCIAKRNVSLKADEDDERKLKLIVDYS
jgi:hypothetical protein